MIDSLTIATIDTETVGLEGHVYDIAWCIHNKRGDIRIERNFLVEENFTDPTKMMGAFYAGKHFTHYARMLQDGEVRLTPWAEIVATMRADFLVHGVNVVAAYNAGFDFRVLAQTHRELAGEGKMLTDAVKVLDIWQFACETKLSQKAYANIARAMGWISPAGNIDGCRICPSLLLGRSFIHRGSYRSKRCENRGRDFGGMFPPEKTGSLWRG